MSPSIRYLLVFATLACVVAGCARRVETDDREAALTSVTRSGPVSLRVESDHDTLRTVDRVGVRIEVTIDKGATLDGLTIDPESEGWTVIIDQSEAPRALSNASMLYVRTLTLEPFLGGDYAIPSVTAKWSQGDRSGVAVSEALTIEVRSVLDEGDTLEIGELRDAPVATAEAPDTSLLLWLVAILGAGVLAMLALGIGLALWLGRGHRDPARAILARLESVATGSCEPGVACAEAAAALRTLDPASAAPRTRDLIDRLDDARFEPEESCTDRTRSLVCDAVEHARSLLMRQGAGA